jgi:hypothetical protein
MPGSISLTPEALKAPASLRAVAEDASNLAAALRRRLDREVRFDAGSRALYATDLSVYRQPPIGVVIPKTIDEVVATVEECRNLGIPILGRGCGTSLAGQTCNIAVVIDFSKYLNRLTGIDPRGIIQFRGGYITSAAGKQDLAVGEQPRAVEFARRRQTTGSCKRAGWLGNAYLSGSAHQRQGKCKTALRIPSRVHCTPMVTALLERPM